MIGDLMLYGTKVAVLIGLAGLVLERVAAWRAFPRRGLWAATLVLSAAQISALQQIQQQQQAQQQIQQMMRQANNPPAAAPATPKG